MNPSDPMMTAVYVSRFGGTEVLQTRQVPVPEPEPGMVRIRVAAAGVNYADIMQREGLYPRGPKPPFPAGFEVAGTIDAIGPGVMGWESGMPVMAFCAGGYAEYTITPARMCLPVPPGLPVTDAAAIPCQYFTAWHALFTLGRLSAGQSVLIHAAAGGLGSFMVQLARQAGARVVGVCGTAGKSALALELGCDAAIDLSATPDFEQAARDASGGQGYDLIIESVGGERLDRSLRCLKSRGMLVTLGVAARVPAMVNTVELLANNWIVAGFHLIAYMEDTDATARGYARLVELLGAGALRVVIGHRFPLVEAARAHAEIEARRTTGKVLLIP
ncbi:MAG: zinc-binding dehydrogenase [Candidatus Hydrogenedentes bacterium]|nr:zinc-binding dehydrogenase [Candidatus Hydrogenedentota bacterium]